MYDLKKIKKIKPGDFLYGAGRIRALETKLISGDKLARLCEMNSLEDVCRTLEIDSSEAQLSAMFSDLLSECFKTVGEVTGGSEVFDIWKYPYDCHNIKCALKVSLSSRNTAAGSEHQDGQYEDEEIPAGERIRIQKRMKALMYPFSSVSPDDAVKAVENSDYSVFPNEMANAAETCIDRYSRTRDPKQIDLILDKACFADMLCIAKASGVKSVYDWVIRKIDTLNILMCMRASRLSRGGAAKQLLSDSLIGGGTIDRGMLMGILEYGSAHFIEELKGTAYSSIAGRIDEKTESNQLEKICEDYCMSLYADAKYAVSGAEIPASYIAACECQVKNLRIVTAGKKTNLPPEKIRERLRASYV